MENNNSEWEVVEPNVWKPENEGDAITGKLMNKKENVGPNNSRAYYIENEQGTSLVWGSAVLDDRMTVVSVGDDVRITYKGTQPNKFGQMTHIYKVERKKGELFPTLSAAAGLPEPKTLKELNEEVIDETDENTDADKATESV